MVLCEKCGCRVGFVRPEKVPEATPNPRFGWGRAGASVFVNEEEQATIAEVMALHGRGLSLRKIVSTLTDQGRKPRGTKWNKTTVERIIACQKGM